MLDNNSKIKLKRCVGTYNQIPHLEILLNQIWGLKHLYDSNYLNYYIYIYLALEQEHIRYMYIGKGKGYRDCSKHNHPNIWDNSNTLIIRLSGIHPDNYSLLEGCLIKNINPKYNKILTGYNDDWINNNIPKNVGINLSKCLRYLISLNSSLFYE